MKYRLAFTMIELIFVIVIMGILSKFGVEFLSQAYKSFLYEKTNSLLQSQSEMAVEIIAAKLQYRIKDSVIARKSDNIPIPINSASGENYTVLEWIGADNDGFRGTSKPYWSGIIDLDQSNSTILVSPDTNTSAVNDLIFTLSDGDTNITDAAIYFIGSNSDAAKDYGWDGNISYINQQLGAIHPIQNVSLNLNQFQPAVGTSNFTGVDIYEYYKLAWSAYAVVMDYNDTDHRGILKLYYDYQPWQGESYLNGKETVIMKNVSTFKFMSIGSIMKIQVCTKSDILKDDGGDYSLCKEKTIL